MWHNLPFIGCEALDYKSKIENKFFNILQWYDTFHERTE